MLKVEFNGSLSDLLAFLKRARFEDNSQIDCIIKAATPPIQLTPEALAHGAVIPFVGTTNKIGAIKEIRAATGWGLAESKAWVEKHYPSIRFST